MLKKRVAVLRGGPSVEHDISMQTGASILPILSDLGHTAKDIIISKTGEWLVAGHVKSPDQALVDIDVVFIAMHGVYGEDGTLQRILNRHAIPYTGSGPFASAIALNKQLAKEYVRNVGLVAPRSLKLTQTGMADLIQTTESIAQLFPAPYVVKPARGGASIDVMVVSSKTDLQSAVQSLLTQYEEIIVEEWIEGREATVGILENFRGQNHYVIPEVEISLPPNERFASQAIKHLDNEARTSPGRFSRTEKDTLQKLAIAAHRVLNLNQYSRSDFIVTPKQIYFLESNSLPHLTENSLFMHGLSSVGVQYPEVIEHLVQEARISN